MAGRVCFALLMSTREKPEYRRGLGAEIRRRRKDLGWTQEKFAEIVQCDSNYVGCVERAEQNLRIDVLHRFAVGLGCSEADLYKPPQ